jgi:hypothetical protein
VKVGQKHRVDISNRKVKVLHGILGAVAGIEQQELAVDENRQAGLSSL